MNDPENTPFRVAVLGAGGLGKAAARILALKREMRLTAMCDSKGFVVAPDGVNLEAVGSIGSDLVEGYRQALPSLGRSDFGPARDQRSAVIAAEPPSGAAAIMDVEAEHHNDPIGAIIERSDAYDGILVALPNLPNAFIPDVIERFVRVKRGLIFSDVLKRTRAVAQLLALDAPVKSSASVVLTGCGATPGILAAAAVLAAQSFIEVDKVDIWWGVGIANWDAYRATIREDIAHLPGYSVERAKAMTDEDVEALLARTHGLLELRHMEHADDVLLQRAGVVDRLDQVEVGGIMDTRHAKKPVSTTMTLTGTTYDGKRSSHKFILGDETTMAANVIGPALGYLKRGAWLKAHGIFGVFGSTEFLPMVVR